MTTARRQLGSLIGFGCLTLALVIAALWNGAAGADASGSGELVAQPAPGAPTETFLGASPLEAPGEVWATARNGQTLARYTNGGGWETIPAPVAAEGGPIPQLGFATGASAGRTTPRGGIVVAGTAGEGRPIVLVRDPGGPLREATEPTAVLEPGESLLTEEGPFIAAQEAGGSTRAFVVPARQRKGVLDFAAGEWAREPICAGFVSAECKQPSENFRAVGIDAGGDEAWLLGRAALSGEGIELFRREPNGGPAGEAVWRQQTLGPPGSTGSLYEESNPLGVRVSARRQGQPLTVSNDGVWVDAVLGEGGGPSYDATIFFDIAAGQVTGSWCDLPGPLCQRPLGAELPAGEGRSFAWAGGGPYGRRTITGVGQGAILQLEGQGFNRIALAGGSAGAHLGAALSAPEEGWLGDRPPLQLTRNPEAAGLQPWPVPFRRPLTAITGEPGVPTGSLNSEAIAVGALGQVARYVPGEGWEPEPLLRNSGARATPTLRGVAWPQPGRAYAVGDNDAMWLWQKATGFWEPDPGAPRNLARANFTAIAFDPDNPNRGYAVGKQGLLLSFGREWAQEPLPPGVPPEANFTSIAFSGDEALATYKFPVERERSGIAIYTGGVVSNDGSGWRVDQPAEAALQAAVPQLVAGLPDGGAVIATLKSGEYGAKEGAVITRPGAGAPWARAAGQLNGFPVALDAVREAGQVRGIASIVESQSPDMEVDQEQVFNQPPPGQPPLLTDPYPLPVGGLLVRQTATGWRNEQRQQYPLPAHVEEQKEYDLPYRADPVLALLVSPGGGEGWAVGGETGTGLVNGPAIQTAGVVRYGPTASPPSNATTSPIPVESQLVNFAVAGGAQCAGPCADLTGSGIGPDRWLKAAVGRAAGIPGLRAFLYTGAGVAGGSASSMSALAFNREERSYSQRLGSAPGLLPAFAAPSQSDLDGSGSLATFAGAFSGYGAPLGSSAPGPGIAPISQASAAQGFYSFNSVGRTGSIRVAVLDYSRPALDQGQRCWLASELASAKASGIPAVVVGSRDLSGRAPDAAADGAEITRILVGIPPPGCSVAPAAASAYFFEYPEENRTFRLNAGARSIPAIGTGTVGYVHPPLPVQTDFVGASGFLIASVDANPSDREPSMNIAPVSVRLIPNIGSLAINPTDGTLIRRSHQALFEGLARRPLAGLRCTGNTAPTPCETLDPEPYVPIPTKCQGSNCATGIFPEYTFTSSDPEVADFVAPDPGSLNPRTVLLVDEKPVPDPHSGLLCTFNPGTTIVTLSTGGLAYSERVTVLGGTAQRPCGTTPLRNRRTIAAPVQASPPPAPAPQPGFNPGTTSLPPVAPPSAPVPPNPPPPNPPPPNPPPPAALVPFLPLNPQFPVLPVAIAPPPPPPVPQVTPPSGTSEVSNEEKEEEVEHSVVHHMAGYTPGASSTSDDRLTTLALPALALLMAIAGASIIGPRARRRRRPRFAYEPNIDPRRHR